MLLTSTIGSRDAGRAPKAPPRPLHKTTNPNPHKNSHTPNPPPKKHADTLGPSLFQRFRTEENVRSVLGQVYGNATAVDDELVQTLVR